MKTKALSAAQIDTLARMANEVLKAQTAKVRLEKMKAEVIYRARATAMVFDLARREGTRCLAELAATGGGEHGGGTGRRCAPDGAGSGLLSAGALDRNSGGKD